MDFSGSDQDSFSPLLLEAMRLAARATELARAGGAGADASRKRDKTPVTIADYASQVILLRALAELEPEAHVHAEEAGSVMEGAGMLGAVTDLLGEVLGSSPGRREILELLDYRGAPQSDVHWFVDPVDGTKGYVRGLRYCIAMARLVEHRPEGALLAVPGSEEEEPGVSNRLFTARRGGGTVRTRLSDGSADPLPPPASTRQSREIAVVASRAHDTLDIPREVKREGWKVVPVSMDSQAKYAALVAGLGHLYPRKPSRWIGPFLVWDHAPGALLLEEAGGVVTDLAGRPLDWSHGDRLAANSGIFAASHPEYHRVFQPMFARRGLPGL